MILLQVCDAGLFCPIGKGLPAPVVCGRGVGYLGYQGPRLPPAGPHSAGTELKAGDTSGAKTVCIETFPAAQQLFHTLCGDKILCVVMHF